MFSVMGSFFFFVSILLILLLYVNSIDITKWNSFVLTYFTFFYLVVHIVTPICQNMYKIQRFPDVNLLDFNRTGLVNFYTLMFYCFVIFGYNLIVIKTPLIEKKFLITNKYRSKNLLPFLLVIYVFNLVFFYKKIYPIIMRDIATFMIDRINIISKYNFNFFARLINLSLPIMIVSFHNIIERINTKRNIFIFLFVFVTSSLSNLILGSRLGVVMSIMYVIIYHIYYHKVKLLTIFKVLTSVVLIFMIVALMGNARSNLMANGSQVTSDKNKVVVELKNSFGHNEFFNKIIDKDWEPLKGASFFAIVLFPIPRALWKDKPLGAGPYLKNIIYPGSYKLGVNKANTSYTTGVVLESFLNFKFYGLLIGFLYGVILAVFQNIKFSCQFVYIEKKLLYFFSMLYFAEMTVYGEFFGVYTRTLIFLFPVILYVILKNKSIKSEKKYFFS